MMTKKAKILVVDDEPSPRELISFGLSDEGYEVVTASDGEEALSIMQNMFFDLVLLDIVMPKVDGIEVLRIIKKTYPRTKVIMMSGMVDWRNRTEPVRLGAEYMMSKPFNYDFLFGTVQRVLNEELDPGEKEMERLRRLVSLLEERIGILEKEQTSAGKQKGGKLFDLQTLHNLIAGLAHSVKGELANISASASEFKELGQNNSEIQEEASMILRSAEFSQLLLRRMIEFTKESKAQITALEPRNILQKLKELMEPRLPSNIHLDLDIDQVMAKNKFYGDREGILVVLTELVNNSARALQSNRGTIRIIFTSIGKDVRISVEDNGPGIPDEIAKSLFSNRVNSRTGLGLGLYFCSKLVKSMHGKLKFATQKGNGTSFFIILPLELESQEK